MRFPLVRLLVGVSVGFLGAVTTVAAIGWLDPGDDIGLIVSADVQGEPDFGSYCAERSLQAIEIGLEGDRWRCVGRVNGFWTHVQVSVDDVCREQYAASTARRQDDLPLGWACVNP